jgi:sporulation protein YlmC with PRC-barrel domain
MDVFRDLLDKQIVDRDGHKIGRVDGIIAIRKPGEPLMIDQMELGWITLARRIQPRFEAIAEWLHAKVSVRQTKRYRIRWHDVKSVEEKHVKTALCFEETAAADWELWLREKVVKRIPGSRIEQKMDEK